MRNNDKNNKEKIDKIIDSAIKNKNSGIYYTLKTIKEAKKCLQ
jgi:hypothetical protein